MMIEPYGAFGENGKIWRLGRGIEASRVRFI